MEHEMEVTFYPNMQISLGALYSQQSTDSERRPMYPLQGLAGRLPDP